MEDVIIAGALRTAIGRFGGSLAGIPASTLGSLLVKTLLQRHSIPADAVNDVILGQVLTAGCGQNPARQSALGAGLPQETPAITVNQLCGSGLRAVMLAAQTIRSGEAELVIAGGQENMSAAPHVLPSSRLGQKMGDWTLRDTMIVDGLTDAFHNYHMGCTAENLAQRYKLSREEQDAFAVRSQNRAEAAQAAKAFDDEIVGVEIPSRKGPSTVFAADEYIRTGATVQALAGLKPAFNKTGTVTAGNASGINDGAAALVVASASRAKALGLKPLAVIRGCATTGVDPAYMGIGPVTATRLALKRAGWSIGDLDLIEANEAFAAQSLAVNRELQWDTERVNVNGGAIALGHPIGASGARILVTLLHAMRKRQARRGLATLCVGGGQGVAVAIEAA